VRGVVAGGEATPGLVVRPVAVRPCAVAPGAGADGLGRGVRVAANERAAASELGDAVAPRLSSKLERAQGRGQR
jgi:hypothetical protein